MDANPSAAAPETAPPLPPPSSPNTPPESLRRPCLRYAITSSARCDSHLHELRPLSASQLVPLQAQEVRVMYNTGLDFRPDDPYAAANLLSEAGMIAVVRSYDDVEVIVLRDTGHLEAAQIMLKSIYGHFGRVITLPRSLL